MQLFVIINNIGIMINAGVNAKNWLIKVHAIKHLFGTLVVVSVNVISWDIVEYLDYENCKCRKKLVDKMAVECTGNIDEVKIASENEHKNKCILARCTLCCFNNLYNKHWNWYLFCLL